MIMNEKVKDVFERAVKTFVQASIAFVIADISVLQNALSEWRISEQALLTLAVGAIAAGISAVWNGVLSPLFSKGARTIEESVDNSENELPEYIREFMAEFNIDLSELTAAALKKLADAIDVEVNGKLEEDIIKELNERLNMDHEGEE